MPISVAFNGPKATNIKLNIVSPVFVCAKQDSVTIPSLSKSDKNANITLNFHINRLIFPTDLKVTVHYSYTIENVSKGENLLHSNSVDFQIPLQVLLRPCAASTTTTYNFTVKTNQPAVSILELFSDLKNIDSGDPFDSKKRGFQLHNGIEVSLIVSKTAGNYRIHSNHIEALNFFCNQLIERLSEKFEYNVEFASDDEIQTKEFFQRAKSHYELFKKRKLEYEELKKYTNLYTETQKNLLSKFKEKTPPNLDNLDFLHRHVYKSVIKCTTNIEELNKKYAEETLNLVMATEVLVNQIRIILKMNDDEYEVLKSLFPLDNVEKFEFCTN